MKTLRYATIFLLASLPMLASQAQTAAPQGFECPAAGTRVWYDFGGPYTFHGADPHDTFICMVTAPDDKPQKWLMGLALVPSPRESDWRHHLPGLWPLKAGNTTTYDYTTHGLAGETLRFRHTWTVGAEEPVDAAGAIRTAVPIGFVETNIENPAALTVQHRFWRDQTSRVFLGYRPMVSTGQPPLRAWTVMRIEAPAAAH